MCFPPWIFPDPPLRKLLLSSWAETPRKVRVSAKQVLSAEWCLFFPSPPPIPHLQSLSHIHILKPEERNSRCSGMARRGPGPQVTLGAGQSFFHHAPEAAPPPTLPSGSQSLATGTPHNWFSVPWSPASSWLQAAQTSWLPAKPQGYFSLSLCQSKLTSDTFPYVFIL